MSQVIVVNNSLKITNNLCAILEQRDITVIKAGVGSSKPDFFGIDLVGYQADTIVCSDVFEKEIGGSSKLVSIARQAKLTKIIIIADDSNCNGIIPLVFKSNFSKSFSHQHLKWGGRKGCLLRRYCNNEMFPKY